MEITIIFRDIPQIRRQQVCHNNVRYGYGQRHSPFYYIDLKDGTEFRYALKSILEVKRTYKSEKKKKKERKSKRHNFWKRIKLW